MSSAEGTPAPARIQIEDPQPRVDCGRYPAKKTLGDVVEVSAVLVRDGHEILRAAVLSRGPGATEWTERPMHPVDADVGGNRWAGSFTVDRLGRWEWTVEAWTDPFASWRDELRRKIDAGQTGLAGEMSEGAVLLERARAGAADGQGALIERALVTVGGSGAPEGERERVALDPALQEAVELAAERHERTRLDPPVALMVDPVRARFGSWYELFSRSWGGFEGLERVLPDLAELGFDVIYLPPIHPIGRGHRKGKNNSLEAGPGDPGSPWAIGGPEGGHSALHPDLGTWEDFDRLTSRAGALGMSICIDLAINCSPDHPWLTEHPDWFNRRPDGTLKYAENPPKRYQDIYNVNWDCEDWRGLWRALLEVVLHWVDHGVTVFRVDNPHTKPLPFWEWLIAEVHRDHPDAIFLAEAFTRAPMMRTLAKLGFNQSYTYFTWKSSSWELTDYLTELSQTEMREYFRPNFFTNTPDILGADLVEGGPPAFATRLVLAATLSPTYGIYSGFEHFENVPARPGSEEYLDSEKYEVKSRALDGPLLPMIGRMNAIRRQNPALQHLDNITFLATENEALIAYVKRKAANVILCVVNIDPHVAQEGLTVVPAALGLPPLFAVTDLLDGQGYDWRIGRNYVRLDPVERAAHVLRVEMPPQ